MFRDQEMRGSVCGFHPDRPFRIGRGGVWSGLWPIVPRNSNIMRATSDPRQVNLPTQMALPSLR